MPDIEYRSRGRECLPACATVVKSGAWRCASRRNPRRSWFAVICLLTSRAYGEIIFYGTAQGVVAGKARRSHRLRGGFHGEMEAK